MKALEPDWITSGLIDFEYKKYTLLAYLQRVKTAFEKDRLYPCMADLVFHYNNLLKLKNNQELLLEEMPRNVSHLDLEKLQLVYENILDDDQVLNEIFEIVQYAIPRFKDTLESGAELYETFEKQMELESVGLTPLYKKEGYLLLAEEFNKEVFVFRYALNAINHHTDHYYNLKTEYVAKHQKSVSNSIQNIKLGLIKTFQDLPNPATYAVLSKIRLPIKSTVLPIAKRMLMRHLAA